MNTANFVIIKRTFNSEGKLRDTDNIAVYDSLMGAEKHLHRIKAHWDNSGRDVDVKWSQYACGTRGLDAYFNDGFKKELRYTIDKVVANKEAY